jgi:hypothetical protein
MRGMRWRAALLTAALVAPLPGCGGGGSSPSNPSNPPAGPVRTLVAEGTQGGVPPVTEGVAFFVTVQLPASAVIEATVDWTLASNPVALVVGQGDCSRDANCPILVQNTTTAKPKTVTTPTLTPGIYTLAVVNFGTTNESVSYQIFVIR